MATCQVQPYLFFNGNCEEALEFYKSAVGATVDFMMRYKESPQLDKTLPPNFDDKVCHVTFRIGASTLMAADDCMSQRKFDGFTLSISAANEAEANKYFNGLAAGGRIVMPLSKTFWSPYFGMVTDKFGLGWMVSVPGEKG